MNLVNKNLFPSCSQIKDGNLYREANIVELSKCCQQNCQQNYEYCNNNCNNQQICQNNCLINHNLCNNYCQLASPYLQINNFFYECTEKTGCNTENAYPKKECVKQNYEEIIDCCLLNCSKTQINNCNEFCNYFIQLPFNPKN